MQFYYKLSGFDNDICNASRISSFLKKRGYSSEPGGNPPALRVENLKEKNTGICEGDMKIIREFGYFLEKISEKEYIRRFL